MTQRWLILGLLVGLAGCPKPPAYPNFKTDEHCQEKGQRCVFGTCQQCIEHADCSPEQACMHGRCEAEHSDCGADENCPDGRRCVLGICAP